MTDTYANYAALAAAHSIGVDFDVLNQYGSGDFILHIAIHGGAIESPTTQLAQYGAGTGPYYSFVGKMASGNATLSINAGNFDEPVGVLNVARSLRTVSWHGAPDPTSGVQGFYIGGLDVGLITSVGTALKNAGFSLLPGASELAGNLPANICNRNRISAGLQLEITASLRAAMYVGGDLSLASVANPANRTPTFFRFADTVRAGIAAAGPPAIPVQQPVSSFNAATMPTLSPTESIAVKIPFGIDSTGGLATTGNLDVQQLDRVQALVATLPGERVMRDTYGVASSRVLFAPQPLVGAQIQLMVKDAVATWEPSAVVTAVTSSVNANLGLVNVQVEVAPATTPGAETTTTRVVTVTPGGTVAPLGA